MLSEYSEIITELTEKAQSDEVRPSDLSSFISNRPWKRYYMKLTETFGNFRIGWKESERILDGVKRIERGRGLTKSL